MDKKFNSRGNWWYAGSVCEQDGCNNELDLPENHEYRNRDDKRRVNVCKEHYYSLGRVRSNKSNPVKNSISALAYEMAGGHTKFYKLTKDERLGFRSAAKSELGAKYTVPTSGTTGHGANVVPMFKRDEPVGAPMRTREPSEMKGELVPQGFVYVVSNPDIPHIIKIGKTYPDGIGSIMSNARRFGRAILLEKHYFDEALKAEAGIHHILSEFNMRVLGYEDCGKELFKCSINCFRKALREYHQELENVNEVS